jgi:hypothetical protein
MFFFFSNRLGCAGSLLISAVLTVIVLALMGVFCQQRKTPPSRPQDGFGGWG